MINEIISAFIQVVIFTFVPFMVYLIRAKSVKGFPDYIGLKKSTRKANLLALLVVILLACPLIFFSYTNSEFNGIMTDPGSVTGKLHQMGFSMETLGILMVMAIVKTSLAEEIFFRGFIAKRLIAVTNFRTGNIIHSVIFGAIHALLFLSITKNWIFLAVIFIFPALGAYIMAYLNEKLANGSIIPGWISHGASNLIAYGFIAFAG